MDRKRIVIVGATSAIAEHCARLWLAEAPADLVLVGRDAARLERTAADLRVRSPQSDMRVMAVDLLDTAAIRATVDAVTGEGVVDIVLIAHGSLPDQQACETDLATARAALEVNAVSPVLWVEAFAGAMAEADRGTIAIIGSVAGDRGRKSNYVYGAAKGLVARYAEGMQHRFAATGVKVVLIRPGPTDTPMTAERKVEGARLAAVDAVAAGIVRAIAKGRPSAYVPARWGLIMAVVRNLPAFIFNRMNV
jgi:short-subunit dehydrogenase